MRCACGVVWAEMKKQHRNYFHSKLIYISLFVWPALNFITACFSMQVFDVGQSTVPYLTDQNLVAYLMLGYLCMSFFRCLVQSAWRFSQERFSGTLELIYLSPANRGAILLGNALASLVEGTAVMGVLRRSGAAWPQPGAGRRVSALRCRAFHGVLYGCAVGRISERVVFIFPRFRLCVHSAGGTHGDIQRCKGSCGGVSAVGQVRRRSIPAYLCAGRGAPGFSGRCAYGTAASLPFCRCVHYNTAVPAYRGGASHC